MGQTSRPKRQRAPQTHRQLMARFELGDLVRLLGLPYHTIYSWERRGKVPWKYWRACGAAARQLGVRGVTEMAFRRIAEANEEPIPSRTTSPNRTAFHSDNP